MAQQFFFRRNGKVVGPVSGDAIKKQIASGKIRLTDEIGSASAGPWKAIGDVPALAKLFEPPSDPVPIDDVPEDAPGDDAYGDDAYGDDAYGDDAYGDDAYAVETYQQPPAKSKQKTTPEVTEQHQNKGIDKQAFNGRVIGLLCVGACVFFGLGVGVGFLLFKSEEKSADSVANLFPKGIVEMAEKRSAANEKAKDEKKAFLESLKTNQQPLFDVALTCIKNSLAETAGDEAADAASITVDESSVETFGPEKWKVRGNLKAEVRGNQKDTTWEVTLEYMYGKLQCTRTSLEVRD